MWKCHYIHRSKIVSEGHTPNKSYLLVKVGFSSIVNLQQDPEMLLLGYVSAHKLFGSRAPPLSNRDAVGRIESTLVSWYNLMYIVIIKCWKEHNTLNKVFYLIKESPWNLKYIDMWATQFILYKVQAIALRPLTRALKDYLHKKLIAITINNVHWVKTSPILRDQMQ